MNKQAITIMKKEDGGLEMLVQAKPAIEDMQASLQPMMSDEVHAIAVAMPAAMATEFMLVQILSFLRREGKTISIKWTDHAPSAAAQQIIHSIIQ